MPLSTAKTPTERRVLKFARGDNDDWELVANYAMKATESFLPFAIGGDQILILQNGQNADGSSTAVDKGCIG